MPRSFVSAFQRLTAPRGLAAFTLVLAVLSLASLSTPSAHAQGFGVYEHGTCEMGRAGATVAQPCNASTAIFYNPAGVASTQGFTISGGVTVVDAFGSFTDDLTQTEIELDNDPITVPHVYAQYGLNDKLGIGLGLFVPYGLGTVWPTEGFQGRYLGYDNQLQSIYVQPTVAYQLTDRLSIGVGLDVVFGSVKLTQRIDLSEQVANPAAGITFAQLGIPTGTDFGNVQLDGSGTGFGGHVGIQYEATDWLDLGARFLAPVTVTYDGEADFEQVMTDIILPPQNPIALSRPDIPNDQPLPLDAVVAGSFADGPLVDQDVETEITLPAQFVGGVALQASPQLLLLLDYQWTGWSSFDRLPLDFEQDALDTEQVEDYDDTHGVRLGAEFAVSDAFMLRAGYLTHSAAAPEQTVTPLLPEAYRNEFTFGVGWQPTPMIQIDAAYQFLNQNDRRGRVTEHGETFDPNEDNDGLYSFDAHLFGATVTVRL